LFFGSHLKGAGLFYLAVSDKRVTFVHRSQIKNATMNSLIKKEFYCKLKDDKIKINWNKNPIRMDVFLSFLTIPVEIIIDHLGSNTGWTKRENKEAALIVGGGILNGVEYLDSLQFGAKLSNAYNNYVNPFFIFGVMTKQGKSFFLDYYKDEILEIVERNKQSVVFFERRLQEQKDCLDEIQNEIQSLNT